MEPPVTGVRFPFTGVVLAGGQSRRMGQDKALLLLDTQTTFLQATVHALATLASEVLIVSSHPAHQMTGVRRIPDVYPGKGSLGGIYSGLLAASTDYIFVAGCDMPFVQPALVRYLVSLAPGYDVVIPRLGDELEPLHAIYGRGCLQAMANLIAQDALRIVTFLPQVRVRYVEPEEVERFDPAHLSFFNANTPADLAQARRLFAQRLPYTNLTKGTKDKK